MNWYKNLILSSDNDSSMINRGSSDIIELGLIPGGKANIPVVNPWKRQNKKKIKPKIEDISKYPTTESANLPTSAIGTAPDGRTN